MRFQPPHKIFFGKKIYLPAHQEGDETASFAKLPSRLPSKGDENTNFDDLSKQLSPVSL